MGVVRRFSPIRIVKAGIHRRKDSRIVKPPLASSDPLLRQRVSSLKANSLSYQIELRWLKAGDQDVTHVNLPARGHNELEIHASWFRRRRCYELKLSLRITVVEVVVEDAIPVRGDVGVAVGLSGGGMQDHEQRGAVV